MLLYETHQAAVHEIANEIDALVMDATIRVRFTAHIDRLCKMVEDYGQALQPYADKLEITKERIEKFTPEQLEKYKLPNGTIEVSLGDICPPPKGWIKMDYADNYCVDVPMGVVHRPLEAVNPLLWVSFGWGNAGIQREPTEDEKLMCDTILLTVIHDYELRQPTEQAIFSDKCDGKWFQRNKFGGEVWGYYHYPNQGHIVTDQEKLSLLNRAFERVQAELQPTEVSSSKADLPNSIPAKIWAMLCKLYEITLKAIVDAILDRFWPKPQ